MTCRAETTDRIAGATVYCTLPADHTDQHTDGCMSWCDEPPVPGEECPRCGRPEPFAIRVDLAVDVREDDEVDGWLASVPALGLTAWGITKAEAFAAAQRRAFSRLAGA
jgi:hypothetical protein